MRLYGIVICLVFFGLLAGYTIKAAPDHAWDEKIRKEKNPEKKAEMYNLQAVETINSDPEISLQYARKAVEHSQPGGIQRADGFLNEGIALYYLDEYDKAIKKAKKALAMFEKLNDLQKSGMAENIIGEIYVYTSRYDKALTHLNKARGLLEKFGTRDDMARCYNNLGIIHKNDMNTDEALVYFKKALEYGNAVRKGDASLYLGEVYLLQQRYADAEKHFSNAIRLAIKNDDNYVLADAKIGMARVHAFYGKKQEALQLYREALIIKEDVDDQLGIAIVNAGIGNLYLQMNNPEVAHRWFIKAAGIASAIHTKEELRTAYLGLSNTYHLQNMDDSAYTFLNLYNRLTQEIMSAEASKKLAGIERALEEDKRKQQQEQERFINRVKIYVAGGLILFLVIIAYILFKRFREKKKSNEEIMRQRDELKLQKIIIEEKNKEITDSINYAKRIQMAMLSEADVLKKVFPESFILFKPKDIVSGDFFWFAHAGDKFIYATADCTGHGVPGGFMSMMGVSLLNEIVLERGCNRPGEIAGRLREKVIAAMKQTGSESENKDGMDIVIIAYDNIRKTISYSAANNGFYIIRNHEIISCAPHKQPIGYFPYGMTPFPETEINLETGDRIYTFTDGFADQFGGPRGKKYKYKQLEEVLLKIHSMSMHGQHDYLSSEIEKWQGDLEQNDDICLIGVEIKFG